MTPLEHTARLLEQGESEILHSVISEAERTMIQAAMRHFHGNKQAAARALGITRLTLRARLRAFGLLDTRWDIDDQSS